MRKLFSALMAVTMAAGLTCGCGSSSGSGTTTKAAAAAATTAKAAASATTAKAAAATTAKAASATTAKAASSGGNWPATTIQYFNINSESMGGKQVQAMVDKFNQTNGKNITVNFNFVSAAYPDIASTVQSSLAAGQNVGVVQVGYAYINYFAENFPQMQNLDAVISKYFPDDKDYLDKNFSKSMKNLGYALNGNLAGVAYGLSTPLMYYNADLCKQAGLNPDNPPKTWEEVQTWSEAIHSKTGQYGYAIQNPADTYSIIPMFLSSGIDNVLVDKGNGKYEANIYSDKSVAAWKKIQDMAKNKLYVHLGIEDAVSAFVGGKVAMFLTTSGRATYFKKNCTFDVRSCMQPTFEGNTLKVCVGGNVLSIISQDENQIKASWEFIKYLLQPENIGTWCAATGYLPPTSNADNDPTLKEFLSSNKLMDASVKEKDYAVQWTSWPGKDSMTLNQDLVDMRDAILVNMADVDTTIKTTQDNMNKILANYTAKKK